MKIEELSTEQFAGINKKNIKFSDGLNVIFGENEEGKSTLVRLLSGLLFENVNGRADKNFKESAFPAENSDGIPIDTIDGKVKLAASDGSEHELSKSWGKSKSVKFTLKDKYITDETEINKKLAEILGHGEGVYREMLLSPQSSAAENLKNIFAHKDETSKTLAEAVSEAFAQSDGIATDKIEAKINEKIEKLSEYWNSVTDSPVLKKDGTLYSKGGEVYEAWKNYMKADKARKTLEDLEKTADDAAKNLSEKKSAAEDLECKYNDFLKYAESLRVLKTNEELAKRAEKDIAGYNKALAEYPEIKQELRLAQKLQKELLDRCTLDSYRNAKEYHDQAEIIRSKLVSISCPEEDEIKRLKDSEREIPRLKNKLCGMNTAAKIKMLGGNSVKITSALSGEEIKLDGENAVITEAVRVEIPGVMEMELAPANVDIDEINGKITGLENFMTEIFEKYGCKTINEIEELAKNHNTLKMELAAAENKFSAAVKTESADYAELENAAKAVANPDTVRTAEQINSDISKLCGEQSLERYIGSKQTDLDRFVENYGSEDGLKDLIQKRTAELEAAKKEILAAGNVPEEYKYITDIDGVKTGLKTAFGNARSETEKAHTNKLEAEAKLAAFVETEGDDLREKCDKAKKDLDNAKGLLKNWLHIRQVFTEQRSTIKSDPLQNLADSFANNLKVISSDNVAVEFTDPGKPNFEITSKDYKLDFAKLSDGTRETVYLAFRLAVLDHLFPGGGGIMVLDDPLNDMDIRRVDKACEIIKKSAERHQIIFLTCREEYAKKLGVTDVITLETAGS